MDEVQGRFLQQNESQRDAPLSNIADNYVQPDTLKGTLKSWMIWRFIIYACFTAMSIVVPIIMIPVLGRKYFDEGDDDNENCDTGSYSRYALWYSVFQSISGLIALFSQGYIGRLSDAFGRKKFLYFVWCCTTLPTLPLCFTDNIWFYFALLPISALSGMIDGMPTIMQAAISDVTSPQFRTTVFGILFGVCGIVMMGASFGINMIVQTWGLRAAFYAFCATKLMQLLYLIVVVPESLKESNRKSLEDDKDLFAKNEDYAIQQSIELNKIGVEFDENIQYDDMNGGKRNCCMRCKICCDIKHNPLKPLCYIRSNPVITWIAVLSLLTAFPDNLKLCDEDENSEINSYLVISMSAFMIVSQLIVLPILSVFVHDINMILVTVTTLVLTFLLAVLLYYWSTVYISLILYGFHGMSFSIIPVLSGVLSKRVSPREQGIAMGVIHSVKGLNTVIAPFIFGLTYYFFSHKLDNPGVLIATPFFIGLTIVFLSYPVICCPLRRIFKVYDDYAFRDSIVSFDLPDGHVPPQQLL